ncbi:MAG: sulfatase [Candidatus Brocadiia bacterium]
MSERPNVLVINTDQQRFDALGVNSQGFVRTPHLDGLAAQGANLRALYANNPVCMPSRACFLTGRYCQNHGVRTNGIPLPESEVALSHVLRDAGYATAQLGKLHFLPHAGRDHTQPHPAYGFEVRHVSDEPGCYPDPYIQWVRRVAPQMEQKIRVPTPNVEPRSPLDRWPFEGPEELSHTAWVADRTIEFIRQHKGPWCAVAGFYPPHPPCNPPQRWLELYPPERMPRPTRREREMDDKPALFQRAAQQWAQVSEQEWLECRAYYLAMCSLVDFHCGRIVEALREEDLFDDTLIVFFSDHGDARGDHGIVGKGPTNYDCIVRVPGFFHFPGRLPPGRQVEALVESVDFVPTILEAVGVEPPDGVKGVSRWDLLAGRTQQGADGVLIEFKQPHGTNIKTLVTADYKYWVNEGGEEALFDRVADPHELVNRAPDPAYREAVETLRQALVAKLLAAEDDLPPKIAPY